MPGTFTLAGRSDMHCVMKELFSLKIQTVSILILLLQIVLLTLVLQYSSAFAGDTLNEVRSRKTVRCGISEGPDGFSMKDRAGHWQGAGPDFCRAVAAAALGDANKVEFISLSAAGRFPVLLSGKIDLLAHTATMTFGREAGIGVRFPGVYFFDGQGFMVQRSSKIRTIRDLNGLTVCVVKGTTHQINLANTFQKYNMKYTPLVVGSISEAIDTLIKGKCQTVTADRSQLAAVQATTSAGPSRFEIIPGAFSLEPIGPVVRRGDEEWFTLVRWVLFALIEAEELGLTRDNVRTLLKDPGSSTLRDFLISSGQSGKSLGLRPDWVASVIGSVGNYGEIYERHFGAKSDLKIERGHNKLWTQGGLMYAPQFQ
ncbi:MAG: amino acid ABC transporter substrate-binding protein [Nitrospiraceae bacterium]|nr:amino acid ABC transporter substrate-binding protein [Nitrospiraceae bacterium]